MPRGFVNYHSATIDNTKFKGYRWKTDAFKPGISVLYGLRAKKGEKGGRTTVASIRFSADKFTPAEAKSWLKTHDYSPVAFEKARGEKNERSIFPLIVAMYELTTAGSVGSAGKQFYYPSTDSIDPEYKKKKRGKGGRVIEAVSSKSEKVARARASVVKARMSGDAERVKKSNDRLNKIQRSKV